MSNHKNQCPLSLTKLQHLCYSVEEWKAGNSTYSVYGLTFTRCDRRQ